jgi:DNA transformation protein
VAVDPGFLDHVTDLLSDLGPVQVKRMFGGVGLYQSDLMFALIFGDSLFLKADKDTEAQFEAAGSAPFTYEMKDGRTGILHFWRLPEDAGDDRIAACRWARLAVETAIKARSKGKASSKSGAKSNPKARKEPELLIDGPWDDD